MVTRRTSTAERIEPSPSSADSALRSGAVIAERYEIVRRIGDGHTSTVHEARHRGLDRAVALKCLKGTTANNALLMGLLREARIAATVGHPHVAYVYDVGWLDRGEQPYVAMELLDGRTLADELAAQEALPPHRAVALACQILDGLAATHDHQVVHGDLRPENIFLAAVDGGDLVKLSDFGLGRFDDRPAGPYRAPEQRAGGAPERRSDLYAVGALLHRMLPRPDRHPALASVVERAMTKDLRGRWSTAAEMRGALVGALIEAEPVTELHGPYCGAEETPAPAAPEPAEASGPPTVETTAVRRSWLRAPLPLTRAIALVVGLGLLGFFGAIAWTAVRQTEPLATPIVVRAPVTALRPVAPVAVAPPKSPQAVVAPRPSAPRPERSIATRSAPVRRRARGPSELEPNPF